MNQIEPNKKDIKAIALDLDGTLLNEDHKLSEKNRTTLKKISETNVKIIIATGRSYQSLLPYARELEINGPVVCYNGAAVYQCPSGKNLIEYPLSGKWAPVLISMARETNTHLHFFIDEKWYYEKERQEVELYSGRCGFKGINKSFDSFDDLTCTKAMFIGDPEQLKKLYNRIKQTVKDDIYIAFSTPYFLEVMKKGVSKAKALKETLEKENISLSQVIAFGDGMNDKEMISQCAYGYVMENGSSELKTYSPLLAPSNRDSGVSTVLEGIF